MPSRKDNAPSSDTASPNYDPVFAALSTGDHGEPVLWEPDCSRLFGDACAVVASLGGLITFWVDTYSGIYYCSVRYKTAHRKLSAADQRSFVWQLKKVTDSLLPELEKMFPPQPPETP